MCQVCDFAKINGYFGNYPNPRDKTHCSTCHRSWRSMIESHCTACHNHFSNDRAFLRHQNSEGCVDPETKTNRAGEKVFSKKPYTTRGVVWGLRLGNSDFIDSIKED